MNARGELGPAAPAIGRRGAILGGLGLLVAGGALSRLARRATPPAELEGPDENGLRLPRGFRSRVLARSGEPVLGAAMDYRWHPAPDGGAVFPTSDGYVYVSNSEVKEPGGGGVSALRFGRDGEIRAAYRILGGTTANCAGGPTPWRSWLSCEEHRDGLVWECDPLGERPAVARPALGRFKHEAAAVDGRRGHVYLTEDQPNGRLYRFVSARREPMSLEEGQLQVAEVRPTGQLTWHPLPDADGRRVATRDQVPASTAFNGGEGIWLSRHHGRDRVHFTTKGDDRVWQLDLAAQHLTVLYDAARSRDPVLTGVDNVTVSPTGEVMVAEDGGDMQLVALNEVGEPRVMLMLEGHDGSEITGPAFDPTGRRLIFSSQRGVTGESSGGMTFEVTGPFVG
ncbi:MAG: DUF839 domain-containing protein [Myxococcales bacterium]|nr:DUF839 domain-containing protein [Myxococcales bacterium]